MQVLSKNYLMQVLFRLQEAALFFHQIFSLSSKMYASHRSLQTRKLQ